MQFKLQSEFSPTGDQPTAIKELVEGLQDGSNFQTLLGVTGSGKTFTIANVIQEVNRPTLVLSHNKTLAAQLFSEFKQFFPDNAVEYFVSYYDYYQPEAYIPSSGTFIEKDLSINEEIEKYRLNTTSTLLSGRQDVIVVSSVSCIYGIGNPEDFHNGIIDLAEGDIISRDQFLQKLVSALYSRTTAEFTRGNFRVKGDTVDIFLAHNDIGYRIHFFGNEIEEIESFDVTNNQVVEKFEQLNIYPANLFVTSRETMTQAIWEIQQDMVKQVKAFEEQGKFIEAKRVEERVVYDIEMMKELGYCSGIENYSRYLSGRNPGEPPPTLFEYLPNDALVFTDESHVTVSQIGAMYKGDFRRKSTLSEYGFRLPSCMDNRPLKFEEWEAFRPQTIHVSATPGEWEKSQSIVWSGAGLWSALVILTGIFNVVPA